MRKRALVSVTNKSNLEALKPLISSWDFISTGGTAKTLVDLGISVIGIEDVTGFPEMLDGRLKTLHPNIFGGILAKRGNPEHMAAIANYEICPIDLVVVNLYDFSGKPGIEQIDIGGPSLIRAAAKNCVSVAVVVDPNDYEIVVGEILDTAGTTLRTRLRLAEKAFQMTEHYDREIRRWFEDLDKERMNDILNSK